MWRGEGREGREDEKWRGKGREGRVVVEREETDGKEGKVGRVQAVHSLWVWSVSCEEYTNSERWCLPVLAV